MQGTRGGISRFASRSSAFLLYDAATSSSTLRSDQSACGYQALKDDAIDTVGRSGRRTSRRPLGRVTAIMFSQGEEHSIQINSSPKIHEAA